MEATGHTRYTLTISREREKNHPSKSIHACMPSTHTYRSISISSKKDKEKKENKERKKNKTYIHPSHLSQKYYVPCACPRSCTYQSVYLLILFFILRKTGWFLTNPSNLTFCAFIISSHPLFSSPPSFFVSFLFFDLSLGPVFTYLIVHSTQSLAYLLSEGGRVYH